MRILGTLATALLAVTAILPAQLASPYTGPASRSQTASQADAQALTQGSPIEREMAGGETHFYRIKLASDQYLRLTVIQRGIDVVLRWLGPNRESLGEVNNQNGIQDAERISLVTQAAGEYLLEVRSVDKPATAGRYKIEIAEVAVLADPVLAGDDPRVTTHGLVNSQHPELSGVVLSLIDEQGRPQDGFLRLHDIYNLKLDAEMVVLSACQTALGKEVKGEGLMGLTRGFMYAGAARVVASLWDVRDKATAMLMKRFYEGMFSKGLRPAAALREAQVAMWKEKRWEAPYYWAGFMLQGEWK